MVAGAISRGQWSNPAIAAENPRFVAEIIDDKWPTDDQSGYELRANPVMPTRLRAGDDVLTVPFKKYRSRPLPGEMYVREMAREDLRSYTLILCSDDGLWDMLTGKPMSGQGELVGVVIGAHITSL